MSALMIDFLLQYGKEKSWEELAKEYGIANGEMARAIWKKYRKKMGLLTIKKIEEHDKKITSMEEDIKKGTGTLTANLNIEIKSLEDLIQKCNIDTKTWTVERYIQNYWGTGSNPHWQVKAFLQKKTHKDNFQSTFIKFLNEKYKPGPNPLPKRQVPSRELLIIDKQDAHLNKYDVKGQNDIQERFSAIETALASILAKSSGVGLTVKYIVGSDQFNSEWNNMTTRGTPQENILHFHESFQAICDHEVNCIKMMATVGALVDVTYVPGNHDEYVGWHMINWLKAYFRNISHITFDTDPSPTKYTRFSNSALMFNHGYGMKPQKLAQLFPMGFKDEWSKCDHQYIFVGDKHKEFELDFSGIKFYSLPALSGASSKYDRDKGFVDKGVLTAFVIRENTGISTIYKEPIIYRK